MRRFIADEQEKQYFNALIYGLPGTGKTYSALTLPNPAERVLVLSAEAGTLPLRGSGIEIWELENWSDLVEAYNILRKEDVKQDIVFIDSLTELNEKCKIHIVEELRPQVKGKRQISGMYESALQIDDWGELQRKMVRMVMMFRDLPKHTIFTCLEVYDKDEITGRKMHMPDLNGSLRSEIPAFFDVVVRARVDRTGGEPSYYWQTAGSEDYIAKVRTPPDAKVNPVVEPNWTQLFSILLKRRKKGNTDGKVEARDNKNGDTNKK